MKKHKNVPIKQLTPQEVKERLHIVRRTCLLGGMFGKMLPLQELEAHITCLQNRDKMFRKLSKKLNNIYKGVSSDN